MIEIRFFNLSCEIQNLVRVNFQLFIADTRDGWNLKDMIYEAEYLLGCYYEPGNIRYDETLTDKDAFKAWKKEIKMLRKWLEDFRPYSIGIEPTVHHLNWYDY